MADWNEAWTSEQWRADASQWIDLVLMTYELTRTGEPQQTLNDIFSTQIAVPTDHGKLFFKANNPGQYAEVSVTSVAANLAPDQLVMPLAIEPQRGWMISPDYGETLRALPTTDYKLWARILREFAKVQRSLVDFGETLFDAGLLHLDPAWLPHYIDEQLMLHASMPREHALHLPARDAEELDAQLGEVKGMCEFLAAGPIPLSLEHNDLHRGNAFLPTTPDEPLRFMDLGDAYWAHPFASLGTPVRVMCEELDTTPNDPRIRSAITSYLEQWTDYGPVDELWAYVEPALRAGKLQQHAMAMRVLAGASESDLRRLAGLALQPLAELAQPVFTD
ncbi:phosphotransferase [Zhihengliuella halotolerans]|uniref:phosphotransferase n=1 Tax=Zhihengliuella halotolerans TaxID=370736 RepID=UPI000C7FDDB9|nr:phosphotransferase [Zhihengliuella halotolerans]